AVPVAPALGPRAAATAAPADAGGAALARAVSGGSALRPAGARPAAAGPAGGVSRHRGGGARAALLGRRARQRRAAAAAAAGRAVRGARPARHRLVLHAAGPFAGRAPDTAPDRVRLHGRAVGVQGRLAATAAG